MEAAVRVVTKLLPHSELLQCIASIKNAGAVGDSKSQPQVPVANKAKSPSKASHFTLCIIYELLTVRVGGPVLEVAAWLVNILLLVYIDSETMGETKVDRSFNTI
ncbi:hypothetical protein M0R45_006193 [Rubus argutus]|uniref:Uncharacterized protein n=1 Tax=Rubus argutus TaxID=59490 RepID=A0AAW1YPU0_RUBAR